MGFKQELHNGSTVCNLSLLIGSLGNGASTLKLTFVVIMLASNAAFGAANEKLVPVEAGND